MRIISHWRREHARPWYWGRNMENISAGFGNSLVSQRKCLTVLKLFSFRVKIALFFRECGILLYQSTTWIKGIFQSYHHLSSCNLPPDLETASNVECQLFMWIIDTYLRYHQINSNSMTKHWGSIKIDLFEIF